MKQCAYIVLTCLLFTGCEKFLKEKPNKKLAVPTSLQDYQAILDKYNVINYEDPSAGEISADDYYLTDEAWAARKETEQRMYLWENNHLFEETYNDWSTTYTPVYRANTVLEGTREMTIGEGLLNDWKNVRGQAFFIRGKAFLQAAIIWSLAYDEATADEDLGIPLRLNTDFNEPSARASVRETYQQIVGDLKNAAALLPEQPLHVLRASKPAAYALLARTYLAMRRYDQALLYADTCLKLKDNLMDYNMLDATATYPFPQFNEEVIFDSYISTPQTIRINIARIAPTLYDQYDSDDCRKTAFFTEYEDGAVGFKGSYEGSQHLFSGAAIDEQYLIRSECLTRAGRIDDALKDINKLLSTRYKTGTFEPVKITDKQELLDLILRERRKQLLMRGLRWMDIKRLNKEGAGITLRRTINGNVYELVPNNARFAIPIPEEIISISGMKQNPY